jgi:uncharacterized protein GlcG (DUF336 family)
VPWIGFSNGYSVRRHNIFRRATAALNGDAASEGGFPIVRDVKLIGATGASGGIATQDGATARAGLAAIPGVANQSLIV